LTKHDGWTRIVEVNPPDLPNLTHLLLDGTWGHVMITDNVFGKIRVSPFAYAARITHDVPGVHPTVVVSTRDRNILAIESEVRGALGNGVDSFLVVNGDALPNVDHLAHHYEIVEHLRSLQDHEGVPVFEVGMPTRFREWQFRQRIDRGAQFLVVGPVVDPATVEPNVAQLKLRDGDPPVYLMASPPFSINWVNRIESLGGVPVGDQLKNRLVDCDPARQRQLAWSQIAEIERSALDAGCAGVIVTGLKFDTVVDEAAGALKAPINSTTVP
jgi:5,10-methylenetetrahydrofolate reductase